MPGEFDFIEWLRSQQQRDDRIVVPIGDDLAAVKWRAEDLLLVGVDQVLDGVHFDSTKHAPRDIGRKVMNRNLSDCAAMACLPAYAVATVALPKGSGVDYARELFMGLRQAGERFDCPIVGGDTASWSGKLVVTLTIIGKTEGIEPITRSGARIGDGIYVTGPLGGSLLGRHLTFESRVHLARKLAISSRLTAMIDLSDGLSRDLRHICRLSGVAAVIEAAGLPIHEDAREMSKRDGIGPLLHALNDGEDHELLFTSPDAPIEGIRIGTIVSGEGIVLRKDGKEETLSAKGWEHSL
jgi:thiamine-monophosphate kinase